VSCRNATSFWDMLDVHYLAGLVQRFGGDSYARVREFDLAGRAFCFNSRPHVMGVVNLSQDSWYRESVCLTADAAIARGRMLSAQGADLVDIGAESTLAHAARVEADLQNSMLLPVVRQLAREGMAVSVETYHAPVARASLEAGAAVINLTGNTDNEDIYRMVADHGAGLILCFVQGQHARDVGDYRFASDMVGEMLDYFREKSEFAQSCGVQKILLDPGLGFYYRNLQDSSRRIRHQMEVFLETFRIRSLGWPLCHALPHAFEHFREEVRCAEPFFAVLALLGKTDLLRTHEVARVMPVIRTMSEL